MSFFKKLFKKAPAPAVTPLPPLGGAGGLQQHVPRQSLDVDPSLVYQEPSDIKKGHYYFVRTNVLNSVGKQEISDMYIQVMDIPRTNIVGKILKIREYIKVTDLRPDLHIVADVNKETGEITDFQVLDSENKEVAVNKKGYKDLFIDKEDYYALYIHNLQNEYEESGGNNAEIEALIKEQKENWLNADYVHTKDGAPLPGKWRDIEEEMETDISIKYIGDFPNFGYKFYKLREGGGRRRQRTFRKKRNLRQKTRSRRKNVPLFSRYKHTLSGVL